MKADPGICATRFPTKAKTLTQNQPPPGGWFFFEAALPGVKPGQQVRLLQVIPPTFHQQIILGPNPIVDGRPLGKAKFIVAGHEAPRGRADRFFCYKTMALLTQYDRRPVGAVG